MKDSTKDFVNKLVDLRESLDTDKIYYPPVAISLRLTREQYRNEIGRVVRDKRFRGNYLPKEVYDYGWNIARLKPQKWIVDRVLFWLYAYDKNHTWTKKDFDYCVDKKAYDLARQERKRRKESSREYFLKKHNKPRPLPKIETSWDDVSGPPQDLLEGLYAKLKK